ncbi:MAG TPA: hypothetical protein O0X23_02675 [Methanocorpusculum sp.]|nr:hypothetical protein [Methanocorpusculum sp.]
MLDPEELFVGGGILVIGICAAIGAALLTHFLMRYLHRGAARFLVNAFGYPIAGYILATTMYVAFDIYLHDLAGHQYKILLCADYVPRCLDGVPHRHECG